MEKNLRLGLISALTNTPSANFSADEVNAAAIKGLCEAAGIPENCTYREFRKYEDTIFSLIEEVVDEILPAKLQAVLGETAEVKTFARDQEVQFDIEKIGKNRAKLTIAKGSRAGIYRTAKLANKFFSLETSVLTVAVFTTLEDLLLNKISLSELFNNILEGFTEAVYKDVFNALATATPTAGYNRIGGNTVNTTKATLGASLDAVLPMVKAYGIPTIFGSYQALSAIYNPLANTTYAAGYPNSADSADIRNNGFVQMYKGVRLVELPNYLVDNSNSQWFYNPQYVFVLPSGVKPVKVALRGDMVIVKNTQAVGSEKWEAQKAYGVGVAMANNYAVLTVTDVQ